MTVALMDEAPQAECRVDITPRRLQYFTVWAGQVVHYENIDVATQDVVDQGEVVVDDDGLITLLQTPVSQTANRITIHD